MRLPRSAAAACTLVAGLVAVAACGDPFGLPPPIFPNVEDTVSLYAVSGTPVATPSGYRLEFRQTIRIDQTTTFDFAFDIDAAGQALLLPTGAVGLGSNSGVQRTALDWDAIAFAPDRGYVVDDSVAVNAGDIAIVQSRLTTCSWGGTAFYYAKLEVLEINLAERWFRFRILVDTNCGYRGLELGLPAR